MPARRLFVPKRFNLAGEPRPLDDAIARTLGGRFAQELRKEFAGQCLNLSTVVVAVLAEEGVGADLVSGLTLIDAQTEGGERFVLNHAWVRAGDAVIDLAFPDVIAYYKPGETLPAFDEKGQVTDVQVPADFTPPTTGPIVGAPPEGVTYEVQQPLPFSRYIDQPWGTRTVREIAKKYRLRFKKLKERAEGSA